MAAVFYGVNGLRLSCLIRSNWWQVDRERQAFWKVAIITPSCGRRRLFDAPLYTNNIAGAAPTALSTAQG